MTDTRTIVVSVIGTGIAVVTVIVGFMAIIASGIHARFDDLNARIGDMEARLDARIDDAIMNIEPAID